MGVFLKAVDIFIPKSALLRPSIQTDRTKMSRVSFCLALTGPGSQAFCGTTDADSSRRFLRAAV